MTEKETDEAVKEIREDILLKENHKIKTQKKLIFDGRQYSLRLPKKYVEEAGIDISKDEFEIVLEFPEPIAKEKPTLKIQLKRK
jgi:hypothetical protein